MKEKFTKSEIDISGISSCALAFLGDSVFELMVREKLITESQICIGKINEEKIKKVCCVSQSEMMKKIENHLTDEEMIVYKRGRNAHAGNVPKKASPSVYHRATGLETLFGFLYLKNRIKRIEELFEIMNV